MTTAELDYCKRRKTRYVESRYRTEIATPGTSPFTIKERGQFAVRKTSGAASATPGVLTVVSTTTRSIGVPAMAAGHVRPVGLLEKKAVVTIAAGYQLLLDCGIGRYKVVAAN